MNRYRYIQDPGHGWVVVPVKQLRRLGIASHITSYSYVRDGFAYLEEDLDASTWADAKKAAGEEFEIVSVHTNDDAACRSFDCYRAPAGRNT